MIRKLLLALVVFAFARVLLSTAHHGLGLAVTLLLAWSLFGYLVWRAWPAVRRDVASVLPAGGGLRFRRHASDRDQGMF